MKSFKKFALVSTLTATMVFGALPFASADLLINRTLKSGVSGDDVKQAQMILSRLGYFSGQATGYYGPVTVTAVKRFQAAKGLTADGILGKSTANALNSALGTGTSRGGEDVHETAAVSSADAVISYAKEFLGKPYVYGADGPNSFDCSGFVMFVFDHVGIGLPHSSSSQSGEGVKVDRSNLAPGDLVFFNTTGGGVSHVGIYIGDGKFIHASSGAGRVVITSLYEDYYTARYVTARRVL